MALPISSVFNADQEYNVSTKFDVSTVCTGNTFDFIMIPEHKKTTLRSYHKIDISATSVGCIDFIERWIFGVIEIGRPTGDHNYQR